MDEIDKKYYADLQRISDQRADNLMKAHEAKDILRAQLAKAEAEKAELEIALESLRAKVASAEVLVGSLKYLASYLRDDRNDTRHHHVRDKIREALATYDKQSEVKHDTK